MSTNRTVNINIDLNNFEQTYKKSLMTTLAMQRGINDAYEELEDILYQKLIENMVGYGLGNSRLISGASVYRQGDSIVINVDGDHAVFVEFGTGIVGMSEPHPNPKVNNWTYVHTGKFEGWWYPTDDSDPNPYKRVFRDGKTYAFTRGMPSRPFVYDTWLYASRIYTQIFRKNINRRLREVDYV